MQGFLHSPFRDSMAPLRHAAVALVLGALALGATAADNYPNRPIRMVIPFAPGGTGDVIARPLIDKLTVLLGQPVVSDNIAGAGGGVAASKVATSPADGYTLLLVSSGAMVTSPAISKVSYDPVKNFVAVGQIASSQCVLVVPASSPITNLQDLMERARANPGGLTYGSAGVGSLCHLAGELFKSRAGISITHVPYRGGSPLDVDLIGGRLDMALPGLGTTTPNILAGKLRAIATTGARRSPALPQVPTLSEQGVKDYDAAVFWGVVAPIGTPPEIVRKVNAAIREIVAMPEVAKFWTSKGQDPVSGTPEQFGKVISDDFTKWKAIIKSANLSE